MRFRWYNTFILSSDYEYVECVDKVGNISLFFDGNRNFWNILSGANVARFYGGIIDDIVNVLGLVFDLCTEKNKKIAISVIKSMSSLL